MKLKPAIFLLAGAVVALAALLMIDRGDAHARGQEIYVPAAASMAVALERLAAEFENSTGVKVRLDMASSGLLRKKIQAGARVDAFISASARDMDMLEQSGHVMAGTRRDLLRNTLVCVVRNESTLRIASLADLAGEDVRRIAIGDPAHVPAGIYAKEALTSAGMWDVLYDKLVPCADARAAVVQVKVGAVQAGIVYVSDVATSTEFAVAFEFPPGGHTPIVYPACVLSDATSPASAGEFIEFLGTDHAADVFAACGFESISGKVKAAHVE